MKGFNLDDVENILEGHLEENTARIAVNETKEGNKVEVEAQEKSTVAKIAELTKQKKKASFSRVGNANINRSNQSDIAFSRARLMMELEERKPTDAKLNEYLMLIGEELLNASQKNSELKKLIKNFGIPKP